MKGMESGLMKLAKWILIEKQTERYDEKMWWNEVVYLLVCAFARAMQKKLTEMLAKIELKMYLNRRTKPCVLYKTHIGGIAPRWEISRRKKNKFSII